MIEVRLFQQNFGSRAARYSNALSPCAKRGAVAGLKGNAAFSIKLQERPLSRSSIRGHQSEIMFGVLVVVFCPDWVAALGFSLGERQIPVIVSSRVVRALWLWSGRTRLTRINVCLSAILHGSLLGSGKWKRCVVRTKDKNQSW